jgi:hypothetical protein
MTRETSDSVTSLRVSAFALAVGIVALAPRLIRAWDSREGIIARSTPDDAFYYFAIARNILDGNGATFDGINVTNGFHPLWLALITPFWVFGGDTPIHLALTLGALFGAATASLIFLLLHHATRSVLPGLLGGLFFALHPAIVTDSVNGLESSLTVVLIALALFALLRLRLAEPDAETRSLAFAMFGLVCALLMLARTDSVFIVAALVLYIAVRQGFSRWRYPAMVVAVASVCMLPWFIWSKLATGAFTQISGRVGGVYFRKAYINEHGDALGTRVRHGWEVIRQIFTEEVPQSYFISQERSEWIAILAAVLVIATVAVAAWRLRGSYGTVALVVAVAATGFALGLAYHGGVRWFTRTWYYAPAAYFGAVALGLFLHAIVVLVRDAVPGIRPRVYQFLMGGVYTVAAIGLWFAYEPQSALDEPAGGRFSLQMYEGARWMAENTPPGVRAGSFNAGIIGYYAERPVVNLDGVVNEDAYHALDDCTMTVYIVEAGIDYLIDWQRALWLAACGPPSFTQKVVASFESGTSYGAFEIVAVEPIRAN